MLTLNDTASVSRALADTNLCPDLRTLIGLRAWTLCVEQGGQLGTDIRLAAIIGGDTAEAIEAALGYALNETTAAAEARCPPGKSKIDHYDAKVTGFVLECPSSGGKTYYLRYQDQAGHQR